MNNQTAYDQSIDLSQFDPDYQRAELNNGQPGQDIPDGQYLVSVEEARLGRTQSTGKPMLSWTLRILGPTAQDRLLWKHRVISDKTLAWVKEELAVCGVVLEKFSDLPRRLPELRALEITVVKRTRDGRYDIYFQRGRRQAPEMDEELPF